MPVMHNKHTYKTTKNSPNLWIKDFPWKKFLGHKYSRGRVVIYGGKREFVGATILSSLAALRTGTGSVKIICTKHTINTYTPNVLYILYIYIYTVYIYIIYTVHYIFSAS